MCGIAGVYYCDNRPVAPDLLRQMNATIVHRGPDGDGFHCEPGIGLAHRRLSIIDLSGGQQPMSNEDQSIWITYNGEVYNFQDLRQELVARGHRFRTASDTEVIVHAYEEYGDGCVERLRGMFAFAIWDGPRQRLLLARDRLGIKPLYYYNDTQQCLFASELKALLVHPGLSPELDFTALQDYLTYGYIPHHKTIFQRVKKLLPGHVAVVDRQPGTGKLQLNERQYWDLQFSPDSTLSEADWVEGLRCLVEEAVTMHLVSDVPLGAFLSGGLDSSCVVATMAKASTQRVKTFSIGFAEEDFCELPYARQVAECYETEHHELLVRPDAIALLPVLARQFDEPFGDASAIPTYYVSQLAREHVTVALSGDGGDEAFAGYKRYADTSAVMRLQRQIAFLPLTLRRVIFQSLARTLPERLPGHGTLRRLGMSPYETYMHVTYYHPQNFLSSLLHADVRAALQQQEGRDPFASYFASVSAPDALTRMQYLDTKTYLPEDILTKVDRTSMLHSLEARVPLLDHKLLEFAARIPATLKFCHGEGKYIFKRFLHDLLPPNLLQRRKMGFGVPLVHWFRHDLADYTRDLLFSQRSLERGFFNRVFLERLLDDHQHGLADRSAEIWRLLFFEHWCQHYLDTSVAAVSSEASKV